PGATSTGALRPIRRLFAHATTLGSGQSPTFTRTWYSPGETLAAYVPDLPPTFITLGIMAAVPPPVGIRDIVADWAVTTSQLTTPVMLSARVCAVHAIEAATATSPPVTMFVLFVRTAPQIERPSVFN